MKLENSVTSIGTYNNILTLLTSNKTVINMIDEIGLIKSVDKVNFGTGNLIYTLKITNQTDKTYTSSIITDIINSKLVDFITGSLIINGIKASSNQYKYDNLSNTLTINLDDIIPYQVQILRFSVRKKVNKLFLLTSNSTITLKSGIKIQSNTIGVISHEIKNTFSNNWCGTPYWRN